MPDEKSDDTKPELLSLRAYAERRGVALSTVQAAIRTGRISTVPGPGGEPKIDPEIADREFEANTDPSKQGRKENVGDLIAKENARAVKSDSDHGSATNDYMKWRARREQLNAQLKELEYEQKSGKLVNAEEARREFFKIAREARDAIMNIPERISGQLAAETDEHAVRMLLKTELTRALEVFLGANESSGDSDKGVLPGAKA
jgi:phage terminase Nu1 subunit (DNA packaging protein)